MTHDHCGGWRRVVDVKEMNQTKMKYYYDRCSISFSDDDNLERKPYDVLCPRRGFENYSEPIYINYYYYTSYY
jgi:hypothetical protein